MLEKISDLGKPLSKSEQQSIHGGVWSSLGECLAICKPAPVGICRAFGGFWTCWE